MRMQSVTDVSRAQQKSAGPGDRQGAGRLARELTPQRAREGRGPFLRFEPSRLRASPTRQHVGGTQHSAGGVAAKKNARCQRSTPARGQMQRGPAQWPGLEIGEEWADSCGR